MSLVRSAEYDSEAFRYVYDGYPVVHIVCHDEDTDLYTVDICDLQFDVEVEFDGMIDRVLAVHNAGEFLTAAQMQAGHNEAPIIEACRDFFNDHVDCYAAFHREQSAKRNA